MNLPQYNRSSMPQGPITDENPVLANQINQNSTFATIANELTQRREVQAMKWNYTYVLNDSIAGQTANPFNIVIEQGTDFVCQRLTASAFSYDADNASDFPIPNSLGATAWAGRGLSIKITDTRAGRTLTSDYVPLELLGTPGYGLNFQSPYPFYYLFYRNTKIQFDVRNRDDSDRTHYFSIAMNGYKIMTPQ